jgi:hypothetical protein
MKEINCNPARQSHPARRGRVTGCKCLILSLPTSGEKHALNMFEYSALRGIFGPRREGEREGGRK